MSARYFYRAPAKPPSSEGLDALNYFRYAPRVPLGGDRRRGLGWLARLILSIPVAATE